MLQLFNPENDLALAANVANYTPPRAALRLARAGAALPLWYGERGDQVMCHGVNAAWYERVCRDFDLRATLWDHDVSSVRSASPWGWSLAAKHRFVAEGIPAELLPTDEQIEAIRRLSHRRTSIALHDYVVEAIGDQLLTPAAVEVADPARLEALVGDSYLKQPWSGSGRGVVSTAGGRQRALRFGRESIAKQGSVMVEPAHRRVLDFAVIYDCRDGACSRHSTSLFVTDARGAYVGNVLAPEHERFGRVVTTMARHSGLGADECAARLSAVVEALRGAIEQVIAPHYDGIVGVDMFITDDGHIDPVVEVNVRKTMGYVANVFADRYLAEGSTGVFTVVKSGMPFAEDYTVSDGRLVSGTLQLTPPNIDFNFVVQCPESRVQSQMPSDQSPV